MARPQSAIEEPEMPSLFDPPASEEDDAEPEPEIAGPDDIEDEEPGGDADPHEADLAEARQRAREAEERLLEQGRRNEENLLRLLTQREAQAPETAEPLGEAPDPVDDRAGFSKWMQRALQSGDARVEKALAELRASQQREAAGTRLWQEFQAEYPELAKSEGLVKAAFLEETNYTGQIPSDTSGLKRRVAGRIETMRKQLGVKSTETPAGGRTETASPTRAARRERRQRGKEDESAPKSLAETLIQRQAASEYF